MSFRTSRFVHLAAGVPALVVLLAATFSGEPAGASNLTGFLPQAGTGVVASSYTDESYDEFWLGETRVSEPALGEITTRSAALWLSWGLTDRWSLVFDLASVDTEAGGPVGLTDSGLQDVSALLATHLWSHGRGHREHSLVAAAGIRTPLDSYEANAPVARGDETTDGLLRLVYLLRIGGFYWSQQLGYDLRGGDAPDCWPVFTEIGYGTGRFTWIASYTRMLAEDGTDIGDPGFTFPSNREELERVGAKVVVELDSRWSAFGGAFTTLSGRNSGDADGFSLGIIRRF